jgi:retinol dehydrogenase 12
MSLDLSDLVSVEKFVDTFKQRFKQLDILINNAGIMALPNRKVSK